MKRFVIAAALLCSTVSSAMAEDVKIATYNIEHWAYRFDTRKVKTMGRKVVPTEKQAAKGAASPLNADEQELFNRVIDEHAETNDKNNWAVAETIRAMDPDIMVFEEGCDQEDLNYFGHRWMNDAYATLKVFPSNTGREQWVGIIAKPGFKVIKVSEDWYKEKDTVSKDFLKGNSAEGNVLADNRLFARGPGFILFESPGGHQFWVGVNHEKSKSGNSLDVTKWRDREAVRMHQIIKEVEKTGPADVIFGGDMNDELGEQEFEHEAGGDSIALIQGPAADGVVLATRALAEANSVSFGGYYNTRYRSMIDHFFVTQSLKDKFGDVKIFKDGLAPMASDHFPVMMTVKF